MMDHENDKKNLIGYSSTLGHPELWLFGLQQRASQSTDVKREMLGFEIGVGDMTKIHNQKSSYRTPLLWSHVVMSGLATYINVNIPTRPLINEIFILGMARYHNFGFGTVPECNTSVSILNRYHKWQITWLKKYVNWVIYHYIYIYIYISGGPLSALTCCVNVRLLSAIKKISPLIYSQSWVGSWVYTTQAMMTFTLIF